jgi:hypothetical protein
LRDFGACGRECARHWEYRARVLPLGAMQELPLVSNPWFREAGWAGFARACKLQR